MEDVGHAQNICSWCGPTDAEITDDHVISRCLGGTLELSLPACTVCQRLISQAEDEVAHRSPFALWRVAEGPGPRRKKSPRSGRVEPQYLLRADSNMGGYAETAVRAGQQLRELPSFEMSLSTHKARKRATTSEQFTKLIDGFKEAFDRGPIAGVQPDAVKVLLLSEHDKNIADDPEFWPRAFLGIDDQPCIRVRSLDEAKAFLAAFSYLVRAGKLSGPSSLTSYTVPAQTPLQTSLLWNDWAVQRVVAKAVVGLVMLAGDPTLLRPETLGELKLFVRAGVHPAGGIPVHQLSEPGEIKEWPDHQVVVVSPTTDRLGGGIVLYGALFSVDLGVPLRESDIWPVAARAQRDGQKAELLVKEEANVVVTAIGALAAHYHV